MEGVDIEVESDNHKKTETEPQESDVASRALRRKKEWCCTIRLFGTNSLEEEQCNMDCQSITRQQLSEHVITYATIEIRVFIARFWAKSSATMICCGQRHNCSYAMIRQTCLNNRGGVFCAVGAEAMYRDSGNIRKSVLSEFQMKPVPDEK
jgi:hypothetical protein